MGMLIRVVRLVSVHNGIERRGLVCMDNGINKGRLKIFRRPYFINSNQQFYAIVSAYGGIAMRGFPSLICGMFGGYSVQHHQKFFFAQYCDTQGIGFFQLAAGGFSGDDVIGFFGHAAGNFAACCFD